MNTLEKKIEENFLYKGYSIQKVENIKYLKYIENEIYEFLKKNVKFKHKNKQDYLNNFHKHVNKNNLNALESN